MGGNGLSWMRTPISILKPATARSAPTQWRRLRRQLFKTFHHQQQAGVAIILLPTTSLVCKTATRISAPAPLLLRIPSAAWRIRTYCRRGKQGNLFVGSRQHGHYNGTDGINGMTARSWSRCRARLARVNSPAYFNNRIYYHGNGDVLKAF